MARRARASAGDFFIEKLLETATHAAEDNQGQELSQGVREITELERHVEKLHTEYAKKLRAEEVEPRIESPWKQKQSREIPWRRLFPQRSKAGKCEEPRNWRSDRHTDGTARRGKAQRRAAQ
jgi:hypothetical protein